MISSANGFSMSAQDEFDFRPGISMIMPGALAGTPDTAGLPVNGEGAIAGSGNLSAPYPGGTPDNAVAEGTTMAIGEEDDASADQAPWPDKNGLIGSADDQWSLAGSGNLSAPNPGGTPDNAVAEGTTMAIGEEDDVSADQAPWPDKNGLIGFFDPGSDPGGTYPAPLPDAGPNVPDQPFMGAWLDDMSFDLG